MPYKTYKMSELGELFNKLMSTFECSQCGKLLEQHEWLIQIDTNLPHAPFKLICRDCQVVNAI